MNEEVLAEQKRFQEQANRMSALDYASAILHAKEDTVSVETVLEAATKINAWVVGKPIGVTQQ